MARIRSLKPEFWDSPGIETADPFARLLYMAMWNWADDSGVGTANPRELLGFAFPLDEEITVADLRRWLVEIRRVFGVNFYTVAGRPYYSIPSWEKHQKFDRRSKGKHPGPDEADDTSDLAEPGDRMPIRGIPTSPRRDSVAGTGEQGNRGTEEQGKRESAPKRRTVTTPMTPDWIPDIAVREAMKLERPDVDYAAEHLVFIDHWISKGERRADWDATWRNWIRRSKQFAGPAPKATTPAGKAPTTRERKIAELELRKTAPNPAIVEQGGLTIPNDHPSLTGQATLQILEGGAA